MHKLRPAPDLCPACGKKLGETGPLRKDKFTGKIVSLHPECDNPRRYTRDLFSR